MAVVEWVAPADKPVLYQTAVSGDPEIWYTSENFQAIFAGLFRSPGKLRHYALRISQNARGANWSIDVAGGWAAIAGPALCEPNEPTEVRYLAYIPNKGTDGGKINIPLTGFNTKPAGTRTHKVWLAVYDKAVQGAKYGAKIVITEDTGSGAAAPQDNPVGYLQLGSFTISPGQNYIAASHITSINTVANDWRQRIDTGSASLTITAGQKSVGKTVAFTPGRFTTSPVITVTQRLMPNGSANLIPKVTSVNQATFDVYVCTGDYAGATATCTVWVDYIAVQEN